jgi:hypothetical protein
MLMKHVAVPFSYSVHVSTPIRGRNGRRGCLLSPLRLLPSRRPYPLRSSSAWLHWVVAVRVKVEDKPH